MEETKLCTRCNRTRLVKYMGLRKNYSGKSVWRCRARSVCSSIARRSREKRAQKASRKGKEK